MLGEPNEGRVAVRRAAVRREIVDAAWDVARERGLAQLTLRDVATQVGMQPPSLYSHFGSKNAIYDAMFAQAWTECLDAMIEAYAAMTADGLLSPRRTLQRIAHSFFDFAVDDLARHQLMNQRTIPGFEPSADAYRPALETLELAHKALADIGVTEPGHVDLYVAILGGLIEAQLANDPGGNRWARLLDDAMNMFADHVGLPAEPRTRGTGSTTTRARKR